MSKCFILDASSVFPKKINVINIGNNYNSSKQLNRVATGAPQGTTHIYIVARIHLLMINHSINNSKYQQKPKYECKPKTKLQTAYGSSMGCLT